MAGSDKAVKVVLTADTKGYTSKMGEASVATRKLATDTKGALDTTEKSTSKFADSAGRSTAALKGMALAGAAVAGGALVSFLGDAVTAAGNLEQSIGGVDSVFKDSAATVHAFGQTSAEAVGMSRNEFNELITVTGAMLKNKGIEDFTNKSIDLVKVGADLSATFGGSAKDAVAALNAAMRGESDPIERYGISLNEAAVNAELAAKGQSKLTGAALEGAKAQARIDIIMRQSADATGAFAREADTLQGQQQRLNAKWEDAKAALGGALLPMLTSITSALSSGVDIAVAAVGAWNNLPGPIKAAAAALAVFVLASKPLSALKGMTVGTMRSFGEAIQYAGQAAERAGGGFKGLAAGFQTFTGSTNLAKGAMSGLKSAGGALMGALGGPWGLALAAGAAALGGWLQAQENARAATEAMSKTLDEQTGKFTAASQQQVKDWLFADIDTAEAQKQLTDLGINFDEASAKVLAGGEELRAYWQELEVTARKHPEAASLINKFMSSMENSNEVTAEAAAKAAVLAKQNDLAKASYTGVADAVKAATGAVQSATAPLKGFEDRVAAIAGVATDAAEAHQKLASAMLDVSAAAGDADAANIAYQASVDAASASVKENGRTLDINTAKGRANSSALLDLKDKALSAAKANLKNGDSANTAGAKMDAARKQFVDLATQMNGGNRKAAEDLANKYGLTRKSVENLSSSMGDVPKSVVSQITVATSAAQAAVAAIKTMLAAIPDQTVYVNVKQRQVGAVYDAARASGGIIPGVSPHSKADDKLIAATSGEYMHQVSAVNKYGIGFMDAVNAGRFPIDLARRWGGGFANGGQVGAQMPAHMLAPRQSPVASLAGSIDYDRLASAIGDRVYAGSLAGTSRGAHEGMAARDRADRQLSRQMTGVSGR